MNTHKNILGILAIFLIANILAISLASAGESVIIKSFSVSSEQVAPGESFKIEIEVENNGDVDLEDVSIGLDLTNLPFIPKDDATEKTINTLDEDDDDNVNFKLEALSNAESGTYKIPITIEYSNKTKSSVIAVTVNSAPKISLEKEDGLLLKAQKNKVSIKIINKGLSKIKFLEVRAIDGTNYDILSSDYLYIGDIDTDDFDTAEFEIFFKENSPKIISFPIQLTYKDIINKEYTQTLSADLRVYNRDEAYSLGLLQKSYTTQIVIAVIAVLIIWFIYRKIRKARRLRAKKQQQE